MVAAIEYAHVADIYDSYVRTDLDVPFFLKESDQTAGDVLELMSGTGRVSIPLVKAGVRLTCVDRSAAMLAILQRKLTCQGLSARVCQMDARDLSFRNPFDLIFIPFHSFAELVSPDDQYRVLASVYRYLSDTGRFICTLHNPVVRQKTIDGNLRLWGKFALEDSQGTLLLWGLENGNPSDNVVNGLQLFEEYAADGMLRAKRLLETRFCLPGKQAFEAMAESVGFRLAALYGDYAYAPFQEDQSPFMIWILQK